MGNREDMRNLLQDTFRNFEPEPERDIWAAVEAEIGPRPFYKKVAWYWYAAAVILMLLAIGVGLRDTSNQALDAGLAKTEVEEPSPKQIDKEAPAVELQDQMTAENTQQEVIDDKSTKEVTSPTHMPKEIQQNQVVEKVEQQLAQEALEEIIPDDSVKQTLPETDRRRDLIAMSTPVPGSKLLGDGQVDRASSLEEMPLVELPEQEIDAIGGSKKRIALEDLSLNDAVAMAGNGIRKLAGKPGQTAESTDGKETIKTYRINFLDISFSRKRHTIKNRKVKS